jgi:hypothetical protein
MDSCSFCLNTYEKGDILWTLPCTHSYHKHCFIEFVLYERFQRQNFDWSSVNHCVFCRKLQCPLCRVDITCRRLNYIEDIAQIEFHDWLQKHSKKPTMELIDTKMQEFYKDSLHQYMLGTPYLGFTSFFTIASSSEDTDLQHSLTKYSR